MSTENMRWLMNQNYLNTKMGQTDNAALMSMVNTNRTRKANTAAEATRQREREEDIGIKAEAAKIKKAENNANRTLKALQLGATINNTKALADFRLSQAATEGERKDAELEIKKAKDKRDAINDNNNVRDFILGKPVNSEIARAQAKVENNRADGNTVYFVNYAWSNEWDAFILDSSHKDAATGAPLTPQDMVNKARNKGVSLDEYMNKFIKRFK